MRPANHPLTRLHQYAAWTRERPDWPAQWERRGERLPPVEVGSATPEVRRTHRCPALREDIAVEICADAVGGSRFNTLLCDGLLPLLTARTKREFAGLWYHWFAGDLPPLLTSGLRQLGFFDGRTQPACHGAAQGLLGWYLEREPR